MRKKHYRKTGLSIAPRLLLQGVVLAIFIGAFFALPNVISRFILIISTGLLAGIIGMRRLTHPRSFAPHYTTIKEHLMMVLALSCVVNLILLATLNEKTTAEDHAADQMIETAEANNGE